MMKYILAVQCVIGFLILLLVILQKSSGNVLEGLAGSTGGGRNNAYSESNFLYNIMIWLIVLFFLFTLILANISNRYYEKMEKQFMAQEGVVDYVKNNNDDNKNDKSDDNAKSEDDDVKNNDDDNENDKSDDNAKSEDDDKKINVENDK
ncbi:MAG: preprotein translocase subunit SecG [Pseudomonadota bacterium]